MLDAQSGERKVAPSGPNPGATRGGQYGGFTNGDKPGVRGYGDTGGASRFFYVAKASRSERNAGLDGLPERVRNITEGHGLGPINTSKASGDGIRENRPTANHHPTVKPIALMRWLIRLVTPPGGLVLDPFMGSGSTGVACACEDFAFLGIEKEAEYLEIARRRIEHARGPMFAAVEVSV